MSRHLHHLIWVAAFTLAVTARPGHAQPQSEPSVSSVVLRFHNGSVLQNAALLDTVEMDTKLGKLSIPAGEIVRIDFGFRLSDEDSKKLEQALKDLASDKHANREIATKTLTGMGKLAFPALLERRKGGDLELTRRVEALLKDIKDRHPVESIPTRRTDILRTADSTVAGQITSATLNVKCEIFGEVKVPLWRLRELRSIAPGGEIVVAVDAGKHGQLSNWLATDYEVTPGARVDITATGDINLDPQNRLGANINTRKVEPQGTTGLTSGEMSVPGQPTFVPGQLVGRIGLDGPSFVIGKGLSLTPTREGKLYLRIVTIWHADKIQAEGSYQVRITSDPYGEPIRPPEPIFPRK